MAMPVSRHPDELRGCGRRPPIATMQPRPLRKIAAAFGGQDEAQPAKRGIVWWPNRNIGQQVEVGVPFTRISRTADGDKRAENLVLFRDPKSGALKSRAWHGPLSGQQDS